jgi:antibiotic biosynthesis monooxygenase (ABM) superfamily enzyme
MTLRIIILRIVLVWLIVWPLVTLMLMLFKLIADDLPLGLQTLVMTGILVPLISLLLAPAMHRLAMHIVKDSL